MAMISPIYRELTEQQQREFEATLLHAIRTSYWGYESAKEIIELAKKQGKYNGVKIGNDAFTDLLTDKN